MITQLKVKKVVAEEVRPLRHAELRNGQNFSTTSYIEDNEESTFHMASILDNKVVTCASYYPEKSLNIKSNRAYRLRGMATDSNFKRKGFASALMQESFKELKQRDCDMLWCNARLGAVNFYKSVGFKLKGDLFDIEGIGPHYYMYKEIY